jgi:hypothetical protein
MAVTYSTAAKTARMNAVITQIDAGASTSTLEIGTASMAAVLAIFDLPDPCGTAASGVLTFDFDPDLSTTGEAAASTGTTAVEARIKDGDGTVVISGLTVGAASSGEDIELSNVSIASGQTVTLATGTITHA